LNTLWLLVVVLAGVKVLLQVLVAVAVLAGFCKPQILL
jgi:hypothetical protein